MLTIFFLTSQCFKLSRRCQGIYQCSSSACGVLVRPPARAKVDPTLEEVGECFCGHHRVHIKCDARWIRATLKAVGEGGVKRGKNAAGASGGREGDSDVDMEDDAKDDNNDNDNDDDNNDDDDDDDKLLYWHVGIHSHQPPPDRSISKKEEEELLELWANRGGATGAQLRQGLFTSSTDHLLHRPSAISLHPKFANTRAISYVIGKHVRPPASSFNLLHFLGQLGQQDNKNIFSKISVINGKIVIHLQTPVMKDFLTLGDSDTERADAVDRSGLLTDAHNTFFDGPYQLVATVKWIPLLRRWCPVFYSIFSNEDSDSYETHFLAILSNLREKFSNREDIVRRFLGVMDYSAAQSRGFTNAFVKFSMEMDALQRGTPRYPEERRAREEGAREEAESLKVGCLRHFEASIKGAALKLVPLAQRESFQRDAGALVDDRRKKRKPKTAMVCWEELVQRYPSVKSWAKWWSSDRVAAMLFPAQNNITDVLPETSNGVESLHNLLLVGSGGEKFGFEEGVNHLVDFLLVFDGLNTSAKREILAPLDVH